VSEIFMIGRNKSAFPMQHKQHSNTRTIPSDLRSLAQERLLHNRLSISDYSFLPNEMRTAFTSNEENIKAKKAGCDRFIKKTMKKSELLTC